jgi:hypothetical protein
MSEIVLGCEGDRRVYGVGNGSESGDVMKSEV